MFWYSESLISLTKDMTNFRTAIDFSTHLFVINAKPSQNRFYADNPKISPIYVVKEMLGFRSD